MNRGWLKRGGEAGGPEPARAAHVALMRNSCEGSQPPGCSEPCTRDNPGFQSVPAKGTWPPHHPNNEVNLELEELRTVFSLLFFFFAKSTCTQQTDFNPQTQAIHNTRSPGEEAKRGDGRGWGERGGG